MGQFSAGKVGQFSAGIFNQLLPKWNSLLDVVNCGGTIKEVRELEVYMCPDTGGPYSHRRARFFGAYANKTVSYVYEISAVIKLGQNQSDPKVYWKNKKSPDQDLIKEALERFNKCEQWRKDENSQIPTQIFILENGFPTDFKKNTPGGMYGSKKYFQIDQPVENVKELAEYLRGKTWDKYAVDIEE